MAIEKVDMINRLFLRIFKVYKPPFKTNSLSIISKMTNFLSSEIDNNFFGFSLNLT